MRPVFEAGPDTLLVDGRPVAPLTVARTHKDKGKGLLGTSGVKGALWLEGTSSVHMVGMRYPIDAAVLDEDGGVLAVATLSPWTGLTRPRLRGRAVGAGVLLALTGLGLTGLSPVPSATANQAIPVVDAFVIDIPVQEGEAVARFEGAIHGAYRVTGGTVVYWSLREAAGSDVGLATALQYEDLDLIGGVLADPTSLDVLSPISSGDRCICTTAQDIPGSIDSSRFQAMYTTFPAVPSGTTTIDVDVDGRGTIVVGVPVQDQLPPGPQVDAAMTLLGTGWPAAPTPETLSNATRRDPQDLVGRSTSDGGKVTREGTGAEGLVRFDADVLFDFDRADLNDEARDVLSTAVRALDESGASTVEIVGHTDGQGTAEHNQELSVRRGETVADVLRVALGDDVTVKVEGKGWDEPIASNDTEEGRAKNRRVTISYGSGSEEDER